MRLGLNQGLLRLGLRGLICLCIEGLIERLQLCADKKRQRGKKRDHEQRDSDGYERLLQALFLSLAHSLLVHRAGFRHGRQAVGRQIVWHGILLLFVFSHHTTF